MITTSNRKLIVISPTTSPNICGVSDYAYLTTKELAKFYISATIGVADMPQSLDDDYDESIKVQPWKNLLAGSKNEVSDLLIHYTPTSYAWVGFPASLIREVYRFKKRNPENRVFIFCHELWSNSYSMRFHQIVRNQLAKLASYQLGKIANGISTLTIGQKKDFEAILNKKTVRLGLVGANILPNINDRYIGFRQSRQPGSWAVFGLAHTRLWALQAYLPLLKKLFDLGSLKHIYAIGPADNTYAREEAAFVEANFGKGVLIQTGVLKPNEVSKQLLNIEAAVVKQDADSLYKSGSFAALAAHAVSVICEVPITLSNPPGYALFRPAEVQENPDIIRTEDGKKRREQLHHWFWSTRSWEMIGQDIHTWMSN